MEDEEGRVLAVHLGESANCSSVGSVVDVLFVSSVAASAILAATVVLLSEAKKREETREQNGEKAEESDGPADPR